MTPEETQDPNEETFNLSAKWLKGNNMFAAKNLPPTVQQKLNASVDLQKSLLSIISATAQVQAFLLSLYVIKMVQKPLVINLL